MADTNPELPIARMIHWKEGWTSTMIKACVLTAVFTICLVLLFTLGSLQEIAANFPKYRCNPILMPFASNFGFDTKQNFDFCLTSIFNVKAAEIFTPIYNLLGGFTDIVKLVVDVALGIRKLFSNFYDGVNNFMRTARDRIQALFFSIRMSFLKLNNLMGRVYGTMYAVIWMGTSAMTAGFNLADNDLVHFMFEFCFDPSTLVPLADGRYLPISKLQIGDKLAKLDTGVEPVVTSLFRFQGTRTPMMKIHDVALSSEHYVVDPSGKWLPAKSHPHSTHTPSIPELICLNVSGHMFKIGTSGLIVADYDEHTSPDVIAKTQNLATHSLNGRTDENMTTDEYSLGLDGSFFVRMVDNRWVPLHSVKIGDHVWNSGKVLGIVRESCPSVVVKNGNYFSEAQLIYDPTSKQWTRAGICWANLKLKTWKELYSLITENCSTIHIAGSDGTEYFVRDYREVPLPDMEEAYEDAFQESVFQEQAFQESVFQEHAFQETSFQPQTKILVSN